MNSLLKQRLEIELQALKAVSTSRACKLNPAVYLYSKGARAVFFRLEALSRICRKVYDKKTFDKLYKTFKVFEDALGAIDYYDNFKKELLNENPPRSVIQFFEKNLIIQQKKLSALVKEHDICNKSFYDNVLAKINEAGWLTIEKERKEIVRFLTRQIEKTEEDFKSGELNFNDMELGLHEVRRRIRWISIYASALNGMIQLKKNSEKDPSLSKYLTKETIASPFNKFPRPAKGIKPVYIHHEDFYALSWLINELGILKDEGQKHEAVNAAIRSSSVQSKADLKSKLTKNLRSPQALCAHAEQILKEFIFDKKVFEKIRRDVLISGS